MVRSTLGSLFAGVGGFKLGFERAGWRIAWQVEIDRRCQQVLARHWPDIPRYGDVRHVSGADLAPVDCITFGFPCQDVSIAGKRTGGSTGCATIGVQVSVGVRRLTPRECERLMGWPDDHTRWAEDGSEIPDSVRYRMCGNGVVAPVSEWIGRQLLQAMWASESCGGADDRDCA